MQKNVLQCGTNGYIHLLTWISIKGHTKNPTTTTTNIEQNFIALHTFAQWSNGAQRKPAQWNERKTFHVNKRKMHTIIHPDYFIPYIYVYQINSFDLFFVWCSNFVVVVVVTSSLAYCFQNSFTRVGFIV